jgi:hypothetical protein
MTGLRVLIIACTDTKRPAPGPVPALQLYDGPTFRVLRNSPAPDITLILSAEHGLIDANTLIRPYNTRMDRATAARLSTDPTALSAARTTILQAIEGRAIADCHCVGGKNYACVIREYSRCGLLPLNVTHDARGIGYKLGSLKRWLEGQSWHV